MLQWKFVQTNSDGELPHCWFLVSYVPKIKPAGLTDETLMSHKPVRRQEKWRRLRILFTVSPPTASVWH